MEERKNQTPFTDNGNSLSRLPGWPDPRAVVVGLGRTGIWTARWLAARGVNVTVTEARDKSEIDPGILRELTELGVRLEAGGHREETFLEADFIVLSPGVPPNTVFIESARKRDIPVMGEIELTSRFVKAPIIAVTGTNGKTTVTAFLGRLLETAGFRVFVGGNIGTPLAAHLADQNDADYIVLEVSSFQLDTISAFSPFISIILNISPDHLDRYPDYEAYARSKLRLFENQGPGQYLILNGDDPRLASVEPPSGVATLFYGSEKRPGLDASLDGDRITAGTRHGKRETFSLEGFALPGAHNRENVLAAVLAGMVMGIDAATIQETINSFRGLPHRLELVGDHNGVLFYNDSKATNVDAAARAVRSFDRPLILIAGGRHKGADYGPLVTACQDRLKGAVFMGEAGDLLKAAFHGLGPLFRARTMEEAVSRAFSMATGGDVVLLSPACSSFDMFSDYEHRGRVFKKAVEALAHG